MYLPFQIWNDCLQLLVFRLAREVLSGNCDAGSIYFKLLKLLLVFEVGFRVARAKELLCL